MAWFSSLALCWATACSPDREAGSPAPDFRLEQLAGGRFYLGEQRGRVVLLLFWSTSCIPCKEQLLAVERLRPAYHGRPLVVASICNDPESSAELRRISAGLALGYPTLLDREGTVSARYGVSSVPTAVLLDGQGRIRHRRVGWSNGDLRALQLQLERLLPAASGESGP